MGLTDLLGFCFVCLRDCKCVINRKASFWRHLQFTRQATIGVAFRCHPFQMPKLCDPSLKLCLSAGFGALIFRPALTLITSAGLA